MTAQLTLRIRCVGAAGVLPALLLLLLPTFASAQSPWSVKVAIGSVFPLSGHAAPDADTTMDLGSGVQLVVGLVRPLGCNVEFTANGVILERFSVRLQSGSAPPLEGAVSPAGLQIGLAYKTCRHGAPTLYAGPLIGVIGRDRAVFTTPTGPQAFDLPVGWGFGAQAGVRFDLGPSAKYAADLNVSWQRTELLVGPTGRLGLNPLGVSGGILMRF